MRSFEERLAQELTSLAEALRSLVMESDDRKSEKNQYKTPFYLLKRRLFFINYYGIRSKLVLGFCYGAALDPENEFLSGNSSMVRHYVVNGMYDLSRPELEGLVRAAIDKSLGRL